MAQRSSPRCPLQRTAPPGSAWCAAPGCVWYRRTARGWDRYVIEKEYLTVEAGGAVYDIDGNGYPDLVFGADYQGGEVWWWENPGPPYDPAVPWKRHRIKTGGAHQHHDQVFGDFKGTGRPQLAFWNQGANQLLLADTPADPRSADGWPAAVIFTAKAEPGEGLAAADIDGDGKTDLVAGSYWLRHVKGDTFGCVYQTQNKPVHGSFERLNAAPSWTSTRRFSTR